MLNYLKEFENVSKQIMMCFKKKALANNDTATWPDEFVKAYLNNYLAGQENEDCIGSLDCEIVVIKVVTEIVTKT